MKEYVAQQIESKWQQVWKEKNMHQTETEHAKPKYYVLEQFPYPSGDGLHMGHLRVYSIGDVLARYRSMNGYRVLHPTGADAFGLPAENAAIKRGINPRQWTLANMQKIRDELVALGSTYDWDRYVGTCSPDYYQFTQWLFLLMYERGLVYRKKSPVNWCPDCATVLANEQVINGKCWRCESEVDKKELEQWFLRITDYAERLLTDLEQLPNWPDKVKTMQRNWIGRSEGASVKFQLPELEEEISVFTTRPDTLYGVTYLVLAPEHPLVARLVQGRENEREINAFVSEMKKQSEIERTSTDAEKVGHSTGAFARHPLTGELIPILVANYVLMDYGTGAVMGVPAHDERDFQFAKKFNLPIRMVVQPPMEVNEPLEQAYTGDGPLIHSESFNVMNNREAILAISQHLAKKDLGASTTNYRLRDWLISRQRYWGTPIPIVYCDDCGIVPVPKEQLPVILPEDVTFDGKQNPLTTSESFAHTACPTCGKQARRETDTMDTFIDSSWYFLRFTDAHNQELPFAKAKADDWMQVDEYVGGIEHAVLHLLYSRFITKVLYDAGMVSHEEPFNSLLAQGMVLRNGFKMSKSLGNVVSPVEMYKKYGADTARLFILFAAPPERDLEWTDEGVEGMHRFLKRVWKLALEKKHLFEHELPKQAISQGKSRDLHHLLHQTIKKVTHEIGERSHFNTAISAIMELVNGLSSFQLEDNPRLYRDALEQLILLIAPFAPHITEEIWAEMGHETSVHRASWPKFDPQALVLEESEMVVQINGKVRERFSVSTTASKEEVESQVMANSRVQELIAGKKIRKVIVVPGKLVNIVVS